MMPNTIDIGKTIPANRFNMLLYASTSHLLF